jgi:hypothetical protein
LFMCHVTSSRSRASTLRRRFGIWMFKIDHSGKDLIAGGFHERNIRLATQPKNGPKVAPRTPPFLGVRRGFFASRAMPRGQTNPSRRRRRKLSPLATVWLQAAHIAPSHLEEFPRSRSEAR